MLNKILTELFFKTAKKKWTRLEEVKYTIALYDLDKEKSRLVMDFLTYFLKVDKTREKVMLNSWAYALYQIPLS